MARPTKRLPQGVCLQRRETVFNADVRAFVEALKKAWLQITPLESIPQLLSR